MFYIILCTYLVVHVSCYSIIDGVKDDDEILFWPDKYMVKAVKMSFTSDLTENFISWKTNMSSRVDYNDGAVKSFTTLPDSDDDDSTLIKYKIHPTVSDSDEIEIKCSNLSSNEDASGLETILPSVEDMGYEKIGTEVIVDVETAKYQYVDDSSYTKSTHTLWVSSKGEDEDMYWIPIKYEVLEYNSLLGSESKHEVWYFSDFKTDFEEDVFSVDDYDCDTSNAITHTFDSEEVTKHLLFIDTENDKHVDHVFNSFKNKFGVKYADEKEHAFRRSLFKQRMRLISTVNRQNRTFQLGVTQFADKTREEMLKKFTGLKKRPEGKSGNVAFPYKKATLDNLVSELPVEYDARLYGLVGPVKNQEDCGSCWTYGSTAAVEGALARVNGGRLMTLSNQALVDCAWAYGADGCDGGSDTAAYEWMMNHGMPTEEEYGPYKNKDGFCNISNMTTTYTIRGYTDVTPFSSSALKVAVVNHGPLSVSVEVTDMFGLYSRGIYYEKDCGSGGLNHEVVLVGYGEEDGELFWILKNSWGVTWGNSGFMQISARDNDCGVATEPTYVVM